MFNQSDYKREVLKILWDKQSINRFECELRLLLFIKASEVAHKKPECIAPFPFYFFDFETNTKLIRKLVEHIRSLPPLDYIQGVAEFPVLTWKLLYWVFTNPLSIRPIYHTEIITLKTQTKLPDIPNLEKNQNFCFEIVTARPTGAFMQRKKKYGSFYAYHGSSLENFHSIIHRGLISSLNQNGEFGYGTYLTLNYNVASYFAPHTQIWEHSKLVPQQNRTHYLKCIAIVEVVDDPSIHWHWHGAKEFQSDDLWTKRRSSYCCVVDFDDLMKTPASSKKSTEFPATEIDNAIKTLPELQTFTKDQWQRTFETFINQGFETSNFIKIIGKRPQLLRRSPEKLEQSLECLRETQFGDRNIIALVEQHPEMLEYTDVVGLRKTYSFIRAYAETPKNIFRLFCSSPNIITDKASLTEKKMEYLQDVMKVDATDASKSKVFSHSLEVIKCRHVFLKRLGLFKPKNPKVNSLEPSKNPKMHFIYDTSDREFATKTCGVTLEEFETFRELYKREKDSKNSEDDVDEDY